MAKSVKSNSENITLQEKCFSSSDFTTANHCITRGDDIPMWWKVEETPSFTYREYKKNKKRKENQLKQLEIYLARAQQERKDYEDRLKKEEENYQIELKDKDEAYKARAKKYELELMLEAEEREKKLLEELERVKAQAREEALLHEVERNRRLEEDRRYKLEQRKKTLEEKARLEKERIETEAEEARIKAQIEVEKEKKRIERREKSAKIKEIKLQAERREAEEINAEKLKKAQLEAERERQEQLRLDEELRLEQERVEKEIAERERVKVEHKKEIEKNRMEQERVATLKAEAEKKTIAQLKRAHKVKDIEFLYPKIDLTDKKDFLLVAKRLCLKSRSGETLSKEYDFEFKSGLVYLVGCNSASINDLSMIFSRDHEYITSGGLKVGNIHFHEIKRRDYQEAIVDEAYIVPYAIEDYIPSGSVKKYLDGVVGIESFDKARAILKRFGLNSDKVLRSSFNKLTIQEVTKVMITCALTTSRRVVVMFEPKRVLDTASVHILNALLDDKAKQENKGLILVVREGGKK